MKTNNILGAVFIFILTLSLTNMVGAVTLDSADIEVSMINQIPDPVEPGDTVEVRFRIENQGTESIDNFQFEFVEEDPFSVYSGNAIKNLGSIDTYQTGEDAYVIKYNIKVSENAVAGDNKITVKYTTDNWKSFQMLKDFNINVDENEPIVELISSITEPEVAVPGEEIKLKLKVKSLTQSRVRDVKLSLNIQDTETTKYYFAPIGTSNEQIIEAIDPNEEKEVVFNLATSPDSPIAVEKVPVTLSYLDENGNSHSKNYIIGIKTYEEPTYTLALEEKTTYKKLQKGSVTFSIANTGKAGINYLEIELMTQPMYYKTLSSEKNYIGNLDSDDFDTTEFEIYTENTEADQIPLKVKVKYKDDYGKLFEEVHVIKMDVYDQNEAVKYGLETSQGAGMIINYMLLIIISVFWVSMIINLAHNPMPKTKKILWWIILIGTYVIGGILYYLMARNKNKK
jgi:hypothetical protein